jgi:hypothetical protein
MGNHHALRVIAPTIKELFLADRSCRIFNFSLVAAAPRCVLCASVVKKIIK